MSHWEQLAQDPAKAAIFNDAMQSGTEQVRDAVASAFDFRGMVSIVDVGGGRGTLIAGILKANPHLQGTVFEVEAGLAETDGYLKQQGVRDRCEIVSGSFFESIPAGHDAYLLKNIVHDWNDEKAAIILATCRKAMKPDACLLLVEQIVPARAEDSAAIPPHLHGRRSDAGDAGRPRANRRRISRVAACSGFAADAGDSNRFPIPADRSGPCLARRRLLATQLPPNPTRPDGRAQRPNGDEERTHRIGQKHAGISKRQHGKAEQI